MGNIRADIGQYAVRTHTSTPGSQSQTAKTEGQVEDKSESSSGMTKKEEGNEEAVGRFSFRGGPLEGLDDLMTGDGSAVLPAVAAAKDIGKRDISTQKEEGELTK